MSALRHIKVPGVLACEYLVREVPNPTCLVLLLHGYLQNASYIFRKLEPYLPADAIVLAPTAPYPLLENPKEKGSRMGYSWYFYDFDRDEYLIDMEVGIRYLVGVVETLGYAKLPKIVCGYSQGGYLSPFAARKLAPVRQVIGIACQFLPDELASGLESELPFRMDAIHGADDLIVDPVIAQKNHAILRERGVAGEFKLLPGVGHKISREMQNALRALSLKCSNSPRLRTDNSRDPGHSG